MLASPSKLLTPCSPVLQFALSLGSLFRSAGKGEVVCIQVWGLLCGRAGERLQNDASCPAEQRLLTGANEDYNNGGLAGTQNRKRGFLCMTWTCSASLPPPSPPHRLYPSIPPSQPVLFRSSGAASSRNEIAVHPIRACLLVPISRLTRVRCRDSLPLWKTGSHTFSTIPLVYTWIIE